MTIKKISSEEEDDLGFRKIIEAKDAEIELLKEELNSQNMRVAALRENRQEDNVIISKLADAAASYLSFDGSDKIFDAVKLQGARVKLREQIQSAREATR